MPVETDNSIETISAIEQVRSDIENYDEKAKTGSLEMVSFIGAAAFTGFALVDKYASTQFGWDAGIATLSYMSVGSHLVEKAVNTAAASRLRVVLAQHMLEQERGN